MQCPACGQPQMIEKTVDERLEYSGESLVLNGMHGSFCPECGEGVWDAASYRRYVEAQAAMVRAVTGDVGGDIRRIRKRLKQLKLGRLWGQWSLALSSQSTNPLKFGWRAGMTRIRHLAVTNL